MTKIRLRINGRDQTGEMEPRTHLADFLREEMNLTGTHLGCEHGVCGACTILVDGRPARSCITLAVSCQDADIRTIEGYLDDPVMAALRASFKKHHALQCGFCTPGMLATAFDIVTRLPQADEARIREELAGNLCRCTGYAGIVAAIKAVLADGAPEPSIRPVARGALAQSDAAPQAAKPQQAFAPDSGSAALSLDDGVTLKRSVMVEASADALWQSLKDIHRVAAALPGAGVETVTPDGHVMGSFTVAIGPMRASFGGNAHVIYDEARRSGVVRGSGGDRASRSIAAGEVRFAVHPAASGRARMDAQILYRLSGPLAQFGRGAVVSGIVDQLLAQFTANIAAMAQGRAIAAKPPGGLRLLMGSLLAALRRLLGR
jgi:aerobic carbon-monoxide dehydrogenase small subunit